MSENPVIATDNPMLEAALNYIRIGLPVFPIKDDKSPAILDPIKNATVDEKQVRNWWVLHKSWNIGIPTGKSSGIVVLDLDMHGGKDGRASLISYLSPLGHTLEELYEGVWARTGGGGDHILFRIPEGLTIATRTPVDNLQGVDILGENKYIVVEPSRHPSGKCYEWKRKPFEIPIPLLPDYLLELAQKKTKKIQVDLSDKILEGERHASLVRSAGLMRASGMDSTAIYNQLAVINQTKCIPPMGDADVLGIANSMNKYAAAPTNNGSGPHILTQFSWTDRGNAQRLAVIKHDQLKYNMNTGVWYEWAGHHWTALNGTKIDLHIGQLSDQLRILSQIPNTNDDLASLLGKTANRIDSRAGIAGVKEFAQSLPEFATRAAIWDSNPMLLGMKNGVYDLQSHEFRAGKPGDYISRLIGTEYDANAKCPRFLQFLHEIFSDQPETITFLQTAIGYTITGDTRERALFLLVGKGSNGKSVLVNTFSNLLDDYKASVLDHTFQLTPNNTQTNDLAALEGKRFITATELPEGARLNEARIKEFTGGERIAARKLYQEPYEFRPVGKIWFSSNYAPRIADYTDGMWNRLKRFNFNQQFTGEREDQTLETKLKSELPGILNWCIEGTKHWQAHGLKASPKVVEAGINYRISSDLLNEFMVELCEVGEQFSCLLTPVWNAFQIWENKRGLGRLGGLSYQKFRDRLDMKFKWQPDAMDRRYLGIQLKPSATSSPVQIRLN